MAVIGSYYMYVSPMYKTTLHTYITAVCLAASFDILLSLNVIKAHFILYCPLKLYICV